jgi:uncharacterized membrane protein
MMWLLLVEDFNNMAVKEQRRFQALCTNTLSLGFGAQQRVLCFVFLMFVFIMFCIYYVLYLLCFVFLVLYFVAEHVIFGAMSAFPTCSEIQSFTTWLQGLYYLLPFVLTSGLTIDMLPS